MLELSQGITLHYFAVGACRQNNANLIKNAKSETITFPAGVYLIRDTPLGDILYDTGYNDDMVDKKTIRTRLYNLVMPVTMTADERIDRQLKRMNYNVHHLKLIILSHLHPDNIGGLEYLPEDIPIVVSPGVFKAFMSNRIRDLIFPHYLPKNFKSRLKVLPQGKVIQPGVKMVKDGLGIPGVNVYYLGGHANELLALDFTESKIFLAGDASWGLAYTENYQNLTSIAKLTMNNWREFQNTNQFLQQKIADNYQIFFSHGRGF